MVAMRVETLVMSAKRMVAMRVAVMVFQWAALMVVRWADLMEKLVVMKVDR